MNKIIKINYQNDRQTTSARSLWEFLDKPYTEFMKWFGKYKDYGFTENEDYRELRIKIRTSNNAEHDAIDYEITVDMAKELSMLQKSEKGKIARKYFIDLEKQWDSPEAVMSRALKMADSKIMRLESQLEEQKPKIIFAEALEVSENSILIGELAKILRQNGIEIGQNRLFEWLRNEGYLIKKKVESYNQPTQYSMDLKLFELKKRTINNPDGSVRATTTTKVTGKGQIYFVNKFKTEFNKGA